MGSPGKPTKQSNGPFKFTYTQLEKEGVILESRSFADKKYVFLTPLIQHSFSYFLYSHDKTIKLQQLVQ